MKKTIFVLLTILLITSGFPVNPVKAQTEHIDWMDLKINQTYAFKNGWLNFTLSTSFEAVNISIIGESTSFVFKNKVNGFTRSIQLTDQPSGLYKIVCSSGSTENTQYFTIVDNTDFKKAEFPLTARYKNIDYVLYGNGTLRATKAESRLNLNFVWLKKFAAQEATERTFMKNSDMMRSSFRNPETGYLCNVSFIKVYEGLKMIIFIDTPKPIKFDFDLDTGKSILSGFKQGEIIFDYSDLINTLKEYTTVYRKLNKVILEIPSGKTLIDPILFSSGFESGDFTGWTGTYTGDGGACYVQNSSVISGVYSSNFTDLSYSGTCAAYKTISGTEKKCNVSASIRFENGIPDEIFGIQEYLDFLTIRNVANSVYQDTVRIGIGYNSTTDNTRIYSFFNNSLDRKHESFTINKDQTYKFNLLLDINLDLCLLYIDGVMIFNKTYEFGDQEIDYVYVGIRAKNSNLNNRFSVIADDYTINNDAWIFPDVDKWIYFIVKDFKGYTIEGVNVTLFDNDIKTYIDSKITDSDGLAVFNNSLITDTYGYVLFENVVGQYSTVEITQNQDNNITVYAQYYENSVNGFGWFIGLVGCVVSFVVGAIAKKPV